MSNATQAISRECDFNECDRPAVVATMTSAGNLHVVPMDSDPMDTDFSCETHGAELLPWRHVGWVAPFYA